MTQPIYYPEWDTTKTLATRPPLSYREKGWSAPGNVGEKPPLDYFNWWQNNVYDWVVWLEEEKDRIDDKYLPNNVEKLLTNDSSAAPGEANIGAGYRDVQTYGRDTLGDLYFGLSGAGIQSYSQSVTGNIFFGLNSTSVIEIGSALGSAATKKLISGAKEATFEEIINAATINTWTTPTLNSSWTQVVGNEVKYRIYNNKLEVKGNAEFDGSGTLELFILPSGSRPFAVIYDSIIKIQGLVSTVDTLSVGSDGSYRVLGAAGIDWQTSDIASFNTSLPLD